jgi:nucleoside-diphosphate-sugar epimerase
VSRILITGATGFIGAHVLDALVAQEHEIHALSRRPGAPRERVSWHAVDLVEDPAAAARVVEEIAAEQLLHLAWYAVPGAFWRAPENERWIGASLRLLRGFGEAGGRRAVVAGTCAEYAWGSAILSEDTTPLEPATLYGACKHATHVAATASARELGVSLAWGRVFFLYGPGEPAGRLVCTVAGDLLAGKSVPTTEGYQRRDFMHVRDVASAFVAVLGSDLTGALNIASGHAVTVRELVTLIAENAGGLDRVRFGELPARDGEPDVIVGENRRIRDEVGFRPAISLEQGIAETVAWWRERRPREPASTISE